MPDTPLVYNDPRYWHACGVAASLTADEIANPYLRERMLAIAEQYEMAAEHLVQRLKEIAHDAPPPIEPSRW
jgi:hypothetical protein